MVELFTMLGTTTIDTGVMSEVTSLVTTALSVLNSFPCNVFLYGGFAMLGFKIFSAGKRAAK